MVAAKIAFYSSVAGALTLFDAWSAFLLFWIMPYCTWHIAVQYIRIICEHSAVESEEEEYAITRTTIPTRIKSILGLPSQCRLSPRAPLVSERSVLSLARPAPAANDA